jgi:hypothetical protein
MPHRLAVVCLAILGTNAVAQSEQPAPVNAPPPVAAPTTPVQNTPISPTLPAGATQSPYYIGIQQAFTHESNPFQVENGTARVSDVYSTTTLRAGLNQPVSRQRFYADTDLRYNRYNRRDALNNTGYGLRVGLDWATVEQISGYVGVSADQNLSRLQNLQQTNLRNIVRTQEARTGVRLGTAGVLAFEVGVDLRRVSFSSPDVSDLGYKRTGLTGSVLYRLSSATEVGVGGGLARSTYRSGDASDRKDLFLTGRWTPSVQSNFQARVGVTQVEYDRLSRLDFKGATGNLQWNWRPTPRTAATLFLARDVGQEIGFLRFVPGQSSAIADFSRVTDSLGVRASYELTSKILVDVGGAYSRRELANLLVASASGRETTLTGTLGARWLVSRSINVGCQVTREDRTLRTGLGTSTPERRPYSNDIAGCFGSFTLY